MGAFIRPLTNPDPVPLVPILTGFVEVTGVLDLPDKDALECSNPFT
jgi:hypothetical protein